MLDCPRCASPLDLTVRDCARCGADVRTAIPAGVGLVCRACGTFHSPGHAWCATCGRRLADGAAAVQGAASAVVVPTPPAQAATPTAPTLGAVVVQADGTRGAPVPIGPGALLCGRAAALVLEDAAAAPQHLSLAPAGDTALAEDLGSRGGTFIRLRGAPSTLGHAAEIRIGRQRLRLELRNGGDAGATATAGAGMLVQLWPDGRARAVFPLRSGVNVLGRDLGDVSFPGDRSVSARHARLTVSGSAAVLEDLGSSNGTFVRLAGATRVHAGDRLLVGNQLVCIERLP